MKILPKIRNFVSVAAIAVISCDRVDRDLNKTGDTFDHEIAIISADSIFVFQKAVALETNSKSLISYPYLLSVQNERIHVASRSSELKVFDNDGRFLNTIGNLGNGYGQYEKISCLFSIGDTSIAVYDPKNGRLTVFDNKGNVRATIVLLGLEPYWVNAGGFSRDSYYLQIPTLWQEHPFHIIQVSQDGEVKQGYDRANEQYLGYLDRGIFAGGLAIDKGGRYLYQANCFSAKIMGIDLDTGLSFNMEFEQPSFYKPLKFRESRIKKTELDQFDHMPNVMSDLLLLEDRYIIIRYDCYPDPDKPFVEIMYAIHDLRTRRTTLARAGKARPIYSNNNALFCLEYRFEQKSTADESLKNPKLVSYKLNLRNR